MYLHCGTSCRMPGNLRDKAWWSNTKRAGGLSRTSDIPVLKGADGQQCTTAFFFGRSTGSYPIFLDVQHQDSSILAKYQHKL